MSLFNSLMTKFLSYKNQSIALLCKSMGSFLCDRDSVMKELKFHSSFLLFPQFHGFNYFYYFQYFSYCSFNWVIIESFYHN